MSGGMCMSVYTATKTTAMMMDGVIAPMTLDTLSTFSMPVIITRTSMRAEPIHGDQPNCCCMLEPAPASMTKPMQNKVKMTEMSSSFDTIGWVTRRKTWLCSEAWK